MLRVVHADRLTALRDALLEQDLGVDPFATTTIAVPDRALGRWLSLEVAARHDVAVGLSFRPLPSILVEAFTGDAAARQAGLRALDRERLAAALASLLASLPASPGDPGEAMLASYVQGHPGTAAARRVQLARRLAQLFDGYAETRPEWLDAWDAGGAGPDGAHAAWQRAAYRAVMHSVRGPNAPRWALAARLPAARRSLGLAAPIWPGALHVFAYPHLSASTLSALAALGEGGDVRIYQLDPCAAYWEDVPTRARARSRLAPTSAAALAASEDDPLILQLWGRPARDTIGTLTDAVAGDLDGRFDATPPATALAALLADAAARAPAPSAPPALPAGVRVLACPTPARELEIVAAEIHARLRADPSLQAPGLAVLVAGDVEATLALLPAVFDEVGGLPVHVLDAAAADRGRLPEAMLRLLELVGGERSRRELLAVMLHPHVIGRFPHADPDEWLTWTERLGIYLGADDADHAGTYLEAHPDRFHWDQGLRRLALGAFLGGDDLAELAGRTLAPEPVAPDRQASAATFALLARSLLADARWLGATRAPLRRWAELLDGLAATYLHPAGPDDERDLARVRAALHGLRDLDLDERELGFAEVREWLRDRIAGLRADRGEPLVHGVRVAPLARVARLPARHLFVVGLGATAFPGADVSGPYDLRVPARRGEVSPRDRDRQAFLEVLLAGAESITLSYVARHPVSGEGLEPSSVVHELAEALAPYLGASHAAAAREQLTVHHPLHRWDPRYATEPALATGDAGAVVAGVSAERDALALRTALLAHLGRTAPSADADGDAIAARVRSHGDPVLWARLGRGPALPPSAPASSAVATVSLSTLRAFLEAPVQAWARAVLGLAELDDDPADVADEPLALDRGARTVHLRAVLGASLADPRTPLPEVERALRQRRAAAGSWPVGAFDAAARGLDLELLARWRRQLGDGPPAVRDAFGRGDGAGTHVHPPIRLTLPDGRRVDVLGTCDPRRSDLGTIVARAGDRSADGCARFQLRAAIDHVALAAAGLLDDRPHGHVLLTFGTPRRVRHAPWSSADARAYLTSLCTDLLGRPHAYLLDLRAATALAQGADPDDPTLGYGPITDDAGLAPLPIEEATALAKARLAPLLERLTGDVWFGRAAARGAP